MTSLQWHDRKYTVFRARLSEQRTQVQILASQARELKAYGVHDCCYMLVFRCRSSIKCWGLLRMGPAPHTIWYTIGMFESNGIEHRVGMQEGILDRIRGRDGMQTVKSFIEGLTETGPEPEDRMKWVPLDKIRIGSGWRGLTKG